ncbi:MAG: hypothetical protein L0Y66_16620 [Myxococcaceae bacterium]|nr:hypothetical protein [Myxococcaceae bacterium]
MFPLGVLLLAALGPLEAAAARPCVAVAARGPLAESAAPVLERLARQRFRTLAGRELLASSRRLGLPASSPDALVVLTERLRCEALLDLTSARRGVRFTLDVRALESGTGAVLARERLTVTRKGASRALQQAWPALARAVEGHVHAAPVHAARAASPSVAESSPSARSGTETARAQGPQQPLTPAPSPSVAESSPSARSGAEAAPAPGPHGPLSRGATPREERPPAAPRNIAVAPTSNGPERPRALLLSVGLGVARRVFTYSDVASPSLVGYRLAGAPQLALGLDWFPGAHVSSGPLAHVGLTVRTTRLLFVRSVGPDGVPYGTDAQDLAAGLVLRLPLGALELALAGRYGLQHFRIAPLEGQKPLLPDVDYRYVEPELSASLALGPVVRLGLRGGYLWVPASGEVSSERFFPRLAVAAAEAGVSLGVRLSPAWEVRVGADYRRYLLELHTQAGDPLVAGGARDEHLGGSVALGLAL